MKPIRLVVSDVDGTLVDKQKRLTPVTAEALRRLQAAGVGVALISARPRSGVMPLADTLGLDGPLAAFNGGLIFRRDGSVAEHHIIDPAVAREVMTAAAGMPVDIWIFADDRWYASSDRGLHVEHERIASNQEPVLGTDLGTLVDRADKITFVSDDEPVLRDLHRRCAPWAERATIAQSQTYYLDVTALEANKGAGLTALAAAYAIELDAIAAIGDQANDLPMLELAGLSIAMGNAPDRVKAAADETSRANDADGVAFAIDTIIIPRTGASE